MNSILLDIRFAIRQLRSARLFAFTAIATLALCLGANTAIFNLFEQALMRSLPVSHPEQLVQLQAYGPNSGSITNFGGDAGLYFSYPMYRDLQHATTTLHDILANVEVGVGTVWHGRSELVPAEMVSGNYFNVLGIDPILGRVLRQDDDRAREASSVVVLSYSYWATRMNRDAGVLHQSLLINGHPFEIVGVAPQGFHSAITDYNPAFFVPMTMRAVVQPGSDELTERRTMFLNLVGRLKPDVSATTAANELTRLYRNIRADEFGPAKTHISRERWVQGSGVKVLDDSKGFSPARESLGTPLKALLGMVLLLAVMTCANLATLLMVRAAVRSKEIAIRFSLGASRSRIIRQLLLEGVLIGMSGAALGVLLARPLATAILNSLFVSGLQVVSYSADVNSRVLLFNFGLALLVSVLFSLVPALQLQREDTSEALRQQAAYSGGLFHAVRRTAIVLQIGLSVLLLSGAGLFVRTLHNLRTTQTGIKTDHLITFDMDPTLSGYDTDSASGIQLRIGDALRSIPGVASVAGTTDGELANHNRISDLHIPGMPADTAKEETEIPVVTPGYFHTLGIPLLAGRDFSLSDSNVSLPVAVVNRTLAQKYFGRADAALGRTIVVGDDKQYTIIGVVGDNLHSNVTDKVVSTVFRPYAQHRSSELQWYVRSAAAPETVEASLLSAVRGIDLRLVVDEMQTMDRTVEESIANQRTIALLSGAFALLALLTTGVGLYGVLAYATAQRTREIGIRMALGAQRTRVVGLVLKDTAMLTSIGLAVALPASIALLRLVRSLLFGISPFDPLTLVGCVMITCAMVITAAALPARRAATVDPMIALRTE